jgi:hypothetical protein
LRRAIVRALSQGPDRVGVIVEAATLAEATRCVESVPRLAGVLLEATFPDGGSRSLLDQVRTRHGRCPAHVTSRSTSARERSWVLDRGAAFLSKPGIAGIPLRRFARDCLTRFDGYVASIRAATMKRVDVRESDVAIFAGLLAGWTRSAFSAHGISAEAYMSFIARFRRSTGVGVKELRTIPLEALLARLEG